MILEIDDESLKPSFWFMDVESYEQFHVPAELIVNSEVFFQRFSERGEYLLVKEGNLYLAQEKQA